jgi:formate hydrogenlyase subunit 6/NADH:ubiquinone oxidoreductase subunit I
MSYTIIESCTGCTACTRKCPVNAISGERKQLHHINPDLCIECGACGKVCAYQAILNEEGQLTERVKPEQWLKPVWNYQACVECRICVLACPTGSINLVRYNGKLDGLKPSYPFLQQTKTCIGCCFCEESCPTAAITMKIPLLAAETAVS